MCESYGDCNVYISQNNFNNIILSSSESLVNNYPVNFIYFALLCHINAKLYPNVYIICIIC